jgi:hypothetical protein
MKTWTGPRQTRQLSRSLCRNIPKRRIEKMANATEFQHMRTFSELVTEEVFRDIVTAAIADAKSGDSAAREWIGMYCMGRPKEIQCRLSGIDLSERMEDSSNEVTSLLYPPKKGRK